MIPGLQRRAFNLHDVLMYVAIARGHLRLMTLLVCFCMTAGLLVYVYARPVYYSRATVKVDALALPIDTEKLTHDGNLSAVMSQLVARHIFERVARQLGVNANYRDIELHFMKKVSVHLNSQKNLEIEVWPYTYEWAEKFPELLVREFLLDREEQRIKYRDSVINSYTREMSEVSKKLDQNISAKFNFQNDREVTQAQIELDQLRFLPHEIMLAGKRLTAMEDIKKRVEDPGLDVISKLSLISSLEKELDVRLGQVVDGDGAQNAEKNQNAAQKRDTPGVVVIPGMISPEKPWENLVKEQQRLEQEMKAAGERLLPGHPKMLALQKELDEVAKQLDIEYETAKTRFDLDYTNLLGRKRDLIAKLPKYQEVNKTNEKIAMDASIYTSGQVAWNTMQIEMSRTANTLDYASLKERVNLEYAGMNECRTEPVSPNKLRIFLLSMMAGIGLAIGVPFLIEYLDHTVSNLEQVETTFHIRGLGVIPQIGNQVTETVLIDDKISSERNLIENFRVIRSNLLSVSTLTKAPQVIMVTSAMPKEGKTVISSNLSVSFALTGTRTLIIDADLRRGRLHRVFGLGKSPGLTEVLLGQVDLETAIRPTNKENLCILTAGQHLASGTELLGGKRFTEIMDELRSRFDRIIVDTPPVLGLSETSILQRHVDGVLFVIWSGHTPLQNMKIAVEMLQANNANFYGFILNRLDLSKTTNYYQYYYYSYDYYHNYHALENA